MSTTIYFVRHAQPNYHNHDDLTRELTVKGLADRRLVTNFFLDKTVDAIYSSPYLRAYDTIKPLADIKGLIIQKIDGLRERRVDSVWIEDFTDFSQRQWANFSYKLTDGESLQEVQDRNIQVLKALLAKHPQQNLVIGSHGTALSTLVNYYQPTFTYQGFGSIKKLMPFIAKFSFDRDKCQAIVFYNLFEEGVKHEIPIL